MSTLNQNVSQMVTMKTNCKGFFSFYFKISVLGNIEHSDFLAIVDVDKYSSLFFIMSTKICETACLYCSKVSKPLLR